MEHEPNHAARHRSGLYATHSHYYALFTAASRMAQRLKTKKEKLISRELIDLRIRHPD